MKATRKQAGAKNNNTLTSGKTITPALKLTNQDKIFWPDEHITKGDLLSYYNEIADVILPYLKDRPQSLHRFPDGITSEGFYQKDMKKGRIPLWVKTEIIYAESTDEHIDYLLCNDKTTLLYMVNLGCIDINPWNSRTQFLDHPDWLVIDLDPEEISFKAVADAALETRRLLDSLEINSYCKTSGATGLHIYVPLHAKYDYELVRNFAHLIAQQVHAAMPDTTSIERLPAKRKNKVYLDYLQNSKGQTLAAPYCVRPRPGAPVSTPLEWNEVNAKLDPSKFNLQNMLKRIEKKGDLWQPVTGKGANLEAAFKKLEALAEKENKISS